jgi:hypothetical protein
MNEILLILSLCLLSTLLSIGAVMIADFVMNKWEGKR